MSDTGKEIVTGKLSLGPDPTMIEEGEGYYAAYQRLFGDPLTIPGQDEVEIEFQQAPSVLPGVLSAIERKSGVHFTIRLGEGSTVADVKSLILAKFVEINGKRYGVETALCEDSTDEEIQDLFYYALTAWQDSAKALEAKRLASESPDVARLAHAEVHQGLSDHLATAHRVAALLKHGSAVVDPPMTPGLNGTEGGKSEEEEKIDAGWDT